MSDKQCPFCGEPAIRESVQGVAFRCGTLGPDINGEYSTGHTCDIATWSRLLKEKDAEIERLKAEIEARDHDRTLRGAYLEQLADEVALLRKEREELSDE